MNTVETGKQELLRSRSAMLDLLDWYATMGVDEAIGDATIDRYSLPATIASAPATRLQEQPGAAHAPTRAAPQHPPARNSASDSFAGTPDEVARDAQAIAERCDTLESLREALSSYDGCPLKRTAKNLVFSDGAADARILFVGEGPGRDEDLQGVPFVGRSGQLLDRMLTAIGLDRSSAYICNVIFWRPPGNRNPTPAEMAACRPFSRRQIELVAPDIIVALGAVPAREMTGGTDGILRLRGRWRDATVGGRTVRLMPTLHPAYLLRQPAQKKLAWRDFLDIKAALDGAAPAQE